MTATLRSRGRCIRSVVVGAWMAGLLLGLGAGVAHAETLGGNPGMDQFLPEWRPYGGTLRFALHGDYQIFEVGKIRDAAQTGLLRLQHTLTFEPDVQLTDTFRLHAR